MKDKTKNKEENFEIIKFKNPIFKKKQTVSNEICQAFEIYKLKNNSIYAAIFSESKSTIIFYKYIHKKHIFKETKKLKLFIDNPSQIILKYLYNPLNNKEYIFVMKSSDEIEIYIIKEGNKFEFINKNEILLKEFHEDLRHSINEITKIDTFNIFYNEYEKKIYAITSYIVEKNNSFDSNPININKYVEIKIFKEDKLELIKSLFFDLYNGDVLNLIYKNKRGKKYFILIISSNNIQFTEIKEIDNSYKLENLIEITNRLGDFLKTINLNCYPCIISKGNNSDYLYIANNKGNKNSDIAIIDLFNRKIFKFLSFSFLINSIINWNDNYLIFVSKYSIYVFNNNTYQITTKYINIDSKNNINYAKIFYSKEHKFFCLFLLFEKLKYLTNN